MILETLWDSLKRAWLVVPLPWLLLVIMPIGFAWLWIEYQTTRAARALPFWRRPVPLLPQISLAVGWIIRIARGLLIFWLILFVALAINFSAIGRLPDYPPTLDRFLTSTGRIWQQSYVFLADRLPDTTPNWLLPPALEDADRAP